MFFTLYNFLRGFLELRLTGLYTERFLNLCTKKGIYIWHIRRKSPQETTLRISIPGFFRIREASRKTGTKVKILKKRGLPMFFHRHRKRRGFVAGFILFALILALLSSFIWSVEIDETEKIDKKIIRNALTTCGLDVGVLKYKVKPSIIKEEMLRKVPELSWLWVEVKGTRAFVHLRERTPAPSVVPLDRPANIVAKKDGVITDYVAVRGTAKTDIGQVVQKGALLISGTVETKHGTTLLVHAEGNVRASTLYTKTVSFPLLYTEKADVGVKKTSYRLYFGNAMLPVGKRVADGSYRKETQVFRPLGFIPFIPFRIEKDTLFLEEETSVLFTPEEACSFYGEMVFNTMEIPQNAEITDKKYTYSPEEHGNLSVTCTVSCIEEIGEIREILEETDDGEIF